MYARFPLVTASAMKHSISTILAPSSIVLLDSPFSGDVNLDPKMVEDLKRSMVDGKAALPVISASLSALESLVQEVTHSYYTVET